MTRKIISTTNAPAAIGTYSQAVQTGNTVYISGQIPLDPQKMELVSDDIAAQTQQVFKNLTAIAEAADGSLADFVKLTVYLTDLGHFQIINETMSQFFGEPYPARAAIEVSALPKGAQVEIDAIMVLAED